MVWREGIRRCKAEEEDRGRTGGEGGQREGGEEEREDRGRGG